MNNKLQLWFPIRDSNGNFTISQPFGTNGDYYRANGINILGHNGLDIVCEDKTPVYAAHDGIAYTGKDSKEGLGVVLITKDERQYGSDLAFFKTIYWHLASWNVIDGQEIKVGDLLGYADSTGFSSGTHLHFGLKPVAKRGEEPWQWWNLEQANGYGGAIDPTPYFNGQFADNVPKQRLIIILLQKVVNLLTKLLNKW